jgi:hypothetical protein
MTANYESTNKKANVRLKIEELKAVFGPRISKIADKKTANIEGYL